MLQNTSPLVRQAISILLSAKHTTGNMRHICCAIKSSSTTSSVLLSSQPSETSQNSQHHFHNKKYFDLITFNPYCKYSSHIDHAASKKNVLKASRESTDKASPQLKRAMFDVQDKSGVLEKFKIMYKKYWYVLIPVHCATSIVWFAGFYYLSKSGIDIPALLQTMHVSETIVQKFTGTGMGHVAISFLCYKIATPLRYAVTLGGTTFTIKYLESAGLIKPAPIKDGIVKMSRRVKWYIKNRKDGNK